MALDDAIAQLQSRGALSELSSMNQSGFVSGCVKLRLYPCGQASSVHGM